MRAEQDRSGRPAAPSDGGPSAAMESCRGVGDRLFEFVEGEGSIEERRRIEEHLAICPRCAREASDVSALLGRVRALPVPAASSDPLDGFAVAVRGRIAVERPPRRSGWRRVVHWVSGWASLRPIPALSAAAALGVMLAVGLVQTPRPPQPAPASEAWTAREPLSLAQNLDLIEQLDLLEDLDLLEHLPPLRAPESGLSPSVG